jgi:hypothetical protein
MSVSDNQLTAAVFIERIRSGSVAREFLVVASNGFLPVEQADLVAVLAFLSSYPDEEISSNARNALRDLPTRVLLSFAGSSDSPADQLDSLSRAVDDAEVLEAIIRNRVTSDETLRELAARVSVMLQEVIVVNQERILRAPEILDALLSNPQISPDVRRRANEVREEFFDKRQRAELDHTADELQHAFDEDLSPIADLLEQAAAVDATAADVAPKQLPEEETDPERVSAWTRILRMTVAERVQCAFRGGLTERSILIHDRNKLVCNAVIRSPRLTDSEVEAFAAMRNIEDDVLRIIGLSRQFTSKYNVMLNLVRNPKAPIGVVLPLINRLTLRDLKSLGSDRGVSETVRASARRLYTNRKN